MIDKRRYLHLQEQFEEVHSSDSSIAPMICFCIAFAILVLLRLFSIFGAAFARCTETDEFWYSATGGNWPLAGTLMLILLLLFAWNLLIGIDEWRSSRGTKLFLIANAIGISAMLYLFTAVHDSAVFSHNLRTGLYETIGLRHPLVVPPRRSENACVIMQRFEGRWRVVDRTVGFYGFDIPVEWIEIKPWGYTYAQDETWLPPYATRWRPPYRIRYADDMRWRDGELFDAPWDFDLEGDTLTLETPEWFENERARSRVVLERETKPHKPLFANPHAFSY